MFLEQECKVLRLEQLVGYAMPELVQDKGLLSVTRLEVHQKPTIGDGPCHLFQFPYCNGLALTVGVDTVDDLLFPTEFLCFVCEEYQGADALRAACRSDSPVPLGEDGAHAGSQRRAHLIIGVCG